MAETPLALELRLGNELLVLDAGSGIRRLGLALARDLGENIAHHHNPYLAHSLGSYPGIAILSPGLSPGQSDPRSQCAGNPEKLRAALGNQMDPIQFPVSLESLAGIAAIDEFAADTTTIGSFVVRTIGLNHPGGCTGFRVAAGATSIAYLPDHEPYRSAIDSSDPVVAAGASRSEAELIRFIEGSDLLILDSQYDRTEYPGHIGWGHGCLDDSVGLALRAGVGGLVLFHHDPDHDDRRIDTMLQQARRQVAEIGSPMRSRLLAN